MLLISGLFESAEVCIEHLVHGEVVVTLQGGCLMLSATAHLTFGECFSPNAETPLHDRQEQVSNVQLASIKRSNSRDVSL